MYNTRSRGRVVLSGSARTHQRARVIMPPSNVTPSQALDILMSEEMVPDTTIFIDVFNAPGSDFGTFIPRLSCHLFLNTTLCLKKHPRCFSYNSRKHYRIFIIFGRNITKKASNQKMPPHLIKVSALPCEIENTKLYLFT